MALIAIVATQHRAHLSFAALTDDDPVVTLEQPLVLTLANTITVTQLASL